MAVLRSRVHDFVAGNRVPCLQSAKRIADCLLDVESSVPMNSCSIWLVANSIYTFRFSGSGFRVPGSGFGLDISV